MEERIQEQKGVHMKFHALYQTPLPERPAGVTIGRPVKRARIANGNNNKDSRFDEGSSRALLIAVAFLEVGVSSLCCKCGGLVAFWAHGIRSDIS